MADSPSLLSRLGAILPWLVAGAALVVAVLAEREAGIWEGRVDEEAARCDAVEQDAMDELIAQQRECRDAKDALQTEHRAAIDALRAAWEERERIRNANMKLEVEKARLAGAESVLAAADAPPGAPNPLLDEVRRLRAEIEERQLALAQADAQLAAASEEIERLGRERRKLARALDSANLSVAEAELAREEATREIKRARESAIELEWDRFVLDTVQERCWLGSRWRRGRCKEALEASLLQNKVGWLLCRLENNATPQVLTGPATQSPAEGAQLLLDDGKDSAWLVLCDHSLGDEAP